MSRKGAKQVGYKSELGLVSQDATASVKQEMISSTPGRALRSSNQLRSTLPHSSSLNPSRFASSGFFGRTPSMISLTATMSDWISMKGWCPHKT